VKEKRRIKVIECGGTPHEIGKQYGTAGPPCTYEYIKYKL
jgi:hypothetical protein